MHKPTLTQFYTNTYQTKTTTHIPIFCPQVSDYQLLVESLDPEVVAFAPMVASHHPRVIAVGEGRGDLLRVSLQLADACRLQAAGRRAAAKAPTSARAAAVVLPLATAVANVEVDFASSELPSRPEFVQNDGGGNLGLGAHHRERKNGGNRDVAPDLHDIVIGKSSCLCCGCLCLSVAVVVDRVVMMCCC